MQAFLLAAGLGTRLRPLTNSRPKALVEVDGRTLLEINLLKLVSAGARRVVVNVHHFSNQVIDFLRSRDWGTEVLVSDESGLLMDTGGGLKYAEPLFLPAEPILIHNVDILSSIDLAYLAAEHSDSMSIATLCVSNRETSRYLLFRQDGRLVGWCNRNTQEFKWSDSPTDEYIPLAFSGIAMVNPEILSLLPPAVEPYSIIQEYVKIGKNHAISHLNHLPEQWMDVGKPETLALAAQFVEEHNL